MQEKQTLQFRNSDFGLRIAGDGPTRRFDSLQSAIRHPRSAIRRAFTLTELLVVIAIIAVLAALITAAARRAFVAGTRNRIVLEIKNMNGSMEDFKTYYNAYPPNVMNNDIPALLTQTGTDLVRMFKKAFPRMNSSEEVVLKALAGVNAPSGPGCRVESSLPRLQGGMNAEEAIVFWLGGFSDDPQYPLSGEGGPSFKWSSTGGSPLTHAADEVLENRKWRYEFDLGRLEPRNDDGIFDTNDGRGVVYTITINGVDQTRQINLWEYAPKGGYAL